MSLHVFVAMPYGRKQDIDFDAVYADYLRPTLESAGFQVFRADEEPRAGDIRTDMFQELLLADLVVVDLSIDNPNVWYELGVRHALRARGVLLVQSERPYQPFDIYTDRKLRYHLKDGRPDPERLEADRRALSEMARATLSAWHGRKISPVFSLLDGLEEPDWRSLLLTGDNEFRAGYEVWRRHIEVARKGNLPGDVMLLAEEAPTWALRREGRRLAGKALLKLKQYRLALEQYEAILEQDAGDLDARQQKGLLLGRLGRHDAAREWMRAILAEVPHDPESWCLLGRLEKEEWIARWREPDADGERRRALAAGETPSLLQAVESYMNAFVQDPAHFYSGINACTLRHLQGHLGGELKNPASLPNLEGGVIWACLAAMEREPHDYWARATWAELELLLGSPERAESAWREAVAEADKDWFALDSSRQQLLILRDLGFRPEAVAGALAVLDTEIARLQPPWQPRRVFLFSGHMIDAPGRAQPRFPADKEAVATQAIAAKLDELGMGADDLAICGGACGGDTLFAEAALARGCRVWLCAQFPEAEFLQASVAFAGGAWVGRYYAIKDHPLTRLRIQTDDLGPLPVGGNPYERNNLWQLYTALAHGPDKVRFVALWNGGGGTGPGGTQHMVETVRRHAGRVSILDTGELFGI
ncbi:MAG TPA: TRAFs-binding domain-containing protein [Thiobacillaceae bacterium]|nr:TRAFs-binding domain-containing protein [Thiobacillaceae bacterium]